MYLEHFKITKYPFSLTPNTDFFCELPGHQEALNVLRVSLRSGEGFVKIIGEVGTGKTLLCRLLLSELQEDFITAYIPNPDLSPDGLRIALAHELGVNADQFINQHYLLELIHQKLLEYHHAGKSVVLIIDEAQALSDACLEAVRLLTNLETENAKLLQVVLFGQPELDAKLDQTKLRQLKQRITFSYYLNSLKEHELSAYLCHRLSRAGYTYGSIFTPQAQQLIYSATHGLPRLVNVICHKAMMVAYGKGQLSIDKQAIKKAIRDTQSVVSQRVFSKNISFQNIFLSHARQVWGWVAQGSLIAVMGVVFYYLWRRFL